jgi:hypothetical protein
MGPRQRHLPRACCQTTRERRGPAFEARRQETAAVAARDDFDLSFARGAAGVSPEAVRSSTNYLMAVPELNKSQYALLKATGLMALEESAGQAR